MSLTHALDALIQTLVPDARTTLCEVVLQGGELRGLADKRLEPEIYGFAAQYRVACRVSFIDPSEQQVLKPRIFLRKDPHADAETTTEATYGETVQVFDRREAFYRVATLRDGYLGWVHLNDLAKGLPEATHSVSNTRGHVYAQADIAAPRLFELALGTRLRVEDQDEAWSRISVTRNQEGFVRSSLVEPLTKALPAPTPDAVITLAQAFLETPYVWGGVTAWGCDCSGLVQTVFGAFGVRLPRDSDQQQQCGREVNVGEIQPADLLFFPGHVAISLGGTRFVHANAHHMRVTIDDFTGSEYGASLREKLTRTVRVL